MAVWTLKWKLCRILVCSLLLLGTLAACAQAEEQEAPSESQCRPYIEKALKDLETGDTHSGSAEEQADSDEAAAATGDDDSAESAGQEEADEDSSVEVLEDQSQEAPEVEVTEEPYTNQGAEDDSASEEMQADQAEEDADGSQEKDGDSGEEQQQGSEEEKEAGSTETAEDASAEDNASDGTDSNEASETATDDDSKEGGDEASSEAEGQQESEEELEAGKRSKRSVDESAESTEAGVEEDDSKEEQESGDDSSKEQTDEDSKEGDSKEDSKETSAEETDSTDGDSKEGDGDDSSKEQGDADSKEEQEGAAAEEADSKEGEETAEAESLEQQDEPAKEEEEGESAKEAEATEEEATEEEATEVAAMPEEDLLMEFDIPENLRSRDHITQLLRLDEESTESELLMEKSAEIILRELKRLYDNSIKPLELLYKYRDLSNRHFGDPEIFSKPLVLFMGPWSGGKSSLINYLTDNEFTEWSLRTGAEPSPAYFNILMHGAEPQILDGTQLAADWTFSGLQKFGQGLEERLRGVKLPSKLLEKVNIVEIPGILEVRKQVSRVFPFNDACQWFIDRADIIFLVYDPSKLDVGPETEAILDQLKGREHQTRILLNKADQVKPEELMRVQSALIWNISPLMSSAQPPAMYTASLWSLPYEPAAPARLLQAQERALLRDLREAIDKRIDNKIASARRFAVRVRNHAKMVDCYLTTYYNHKTIFGNKRVVAEAIIEHPQNYHIYEGLSTLTNISRYDLPDPETYRDFFRLNPLYEFQQLSATCTYFRGCPINKLDIAIAYDLPELVGKYKKMVESATPQGMPKS